MLILGVSFVKHALALPPLLLLPLKVSVLPADVDKQLLTRPRGQAELDNHSI